MRRAHFGRMVGAAAVAAVTMGTLSGCFMPMPPPVPQAPNADPIVQGSAGAADVREGSIASDSTTAVELQIDERSAVVLAATSPDGEDLMLRLVGEDVDLENDDYYDAVRGLAFELETRDPLLGAVLDPGSYTIEVAEFSGDRTAFQLQVLTASTAIDAGQSAEVQVEPGQPAVMLVSLATGDESIAAEADFDSVLWAQVPGSTMPHTDDDSGGNSNPLIMLAGEQPQEIVVVVSSYSGEESGTAVLSVE